MNLKTNYIDTRFPSLITGISSFKFDIIASAIFISNDRSKVLEFIPYLKTGHAMMVLQDAPYQPKTLKSSAVKPLVQLKVALGFLI